jgi:hypothetical protein
MALSATGKKVQKLESWHRNCLAVFPTDVLNLMTGYLNGFSILALYNCGSGLLNYKLRKNSAVTHFRVRCGHDIFPPYRDWRNNNFRSVTIFQSLTSLEFTGFDSYAFRYFTSPIVANLPKSLEVIRFDFIEALTMWVDIQKCPQPRAIVPTFDVFPLDEYFPKLRILELRSRYWDRLTIYRGKECIAFNWTMEERVKFLQHIPRSVQYLAATATGCPSTFGDCLPEDLISLSLEGTSEIPTQFVENLNRNLRHLSLTGFCNIEKSEIAKLPPNLETLRFHSLILDLPAHTASLSTERWIPQFPQHLTTLIVDNHATWLEEDGIKLLPSSLTILSLFACSPTLSDSCVQYLPRTLTILELASSSARTNNITHAALMDLPNRLTKLNLASVAVFPWSCLEMLPASLTLFIHHSFAYDDIPDSPGATPNQADEYWRGKAPKKCFIKYNNWTQEEPAN